MRIDKEQLIPTNAPLVGLEGLKYTPLMQSCYPLQLVIILSKSLKMLHSLLSTARSPIMPSSDILPIASTYHLMNKFPTKYEVGEVHGDQVFTRECYIAMLEMDNQLQTMNIEEQRTVVEPVERLKEILLNNSRPDQTTRIGTLVSLMVH